MPRGYRHLQVSFAGGEMAPEMWSRFDDARFRSGVARLRNVISHPRGSAARRPGFALVRAAKDSTHAVRLLPFRYSLDQTYVIEMGRADVDGREIGYFRFHTGGSTLLQTRPDDYKPPITASAVAGDLWTTSGIHSFQTGDPIVITMEATNETVTFDPVTNEVVSGTGPHGFLDGDTVLFRTTTSLPTGLEPGRLYYVVNRSADRFQLAYSAGGPAISFPNAGTGTHKVACMPAGFPTYFPSPPLITEQINVTFYAFREDDTHLKIALTRADAIAGNVLSYGTSIGTVDRFDVRFHYDYRNGSVAFYTLGTASPFYCRKTPWGSPGSAYVFLNDHNDHAPNILEYWVRQPGTSAAVTFDLGTDRVQWAAHGLAAGTPVTFTTTGTLPTGIVAGNVYYVRNPAAGDFQLSASLPGSVIDLSGAPAGTHTAFANGIYEVPHYYAESTLFDVNFTQSGDVLTLVHVDRPAAELRRLGPAHWVLTDIAFNGTILPPTGVSAAVFQGQGMTPSSLTGTAPTSINFLPLTYKNPFSIGETVQVLDLGDIPDSHYIVGHVDITAGNNFIQLRDYESGAAISGSGTPDPLKSRVRPSGFSAEWRTWYVITAINGDDEESESSLQVEANNNLAVVGAFNTLSWSAVRGAVRYRIYKLENGLFGYIGETTAPTLTFIDENIAPDLSITPPLADRSLYRTSLVTFDTVADYVTWTSHGLEAGSPVLFDTDGTLPTGIAHQTTYYVLNPSADNFQLAATPEDTEPIDLVTPQSGVHGAASGFFPGAVTYFEQRRVFGGARLRPQDFWMTASGTERDLRYNIPVRDANRIYNRLAARERSQIRHAVPAGHLLLLTSAAEYRITPLNSDSLTPGSVSARAPTHVGVTTVAPVVVNNAVLFPAARGGQLREMGFLDQAADYVTADISLRASHLFENRVIVQMAYQEAPHPVVWVVSDTGTLLGLTYVPEEQVAGWHEHDINGLIESCAAVAEGSESRLYIIANRGGIRYVERMGPQIVDQIEDTFFVDSGVTYDGPAVSELFVPHLAGQSVVLLADGVVRSGVVSVGGVLTLTTPASTVHVGLSYSCELHTLPLGLSVDAAFGTGHTRNINRVWVRVRNSSAFDAGPDLVAPISSPAPASGQLLTEVVPVIVPGAWDYEGRLYVQQNTPLPLTIVGVTLEVATGGG